jgi:hypothetical protein
MAGEELSREEALAVLEWPDEDILTLMQAAFKVRHAAISRAASARRIAATVPSPAFRTCPWRNTS